MKLISSLLIAGSIAFSGRAFAAPEYVLITDVDDTIKVSHIVDTVSKVIRFLSEPVPFAGMSTLYGQMINEARARGQRSSFIVLSGTPTLFESSVWDFLEIFKFPEPLRLITRPMLLDTQEYKTEAVTTVVEHPVMKDASIILVGDDTEVDFAAYDAALASPKVATVQTQIYIRRVTGNATTLVAGTRKSKAGAFAFDSAADIAMAEFVVGRLSRAAVEKVFSEVEKEKVFERLFVPGEYCPAAQSPRGSDTLASYAPPLDLMKRYVRLEDHLRRRCKGLNAWISGILE